jgi:RNA polymerase sigma factor (sigma-70 family)
VTGQEDPWKAWFCREVLPLEPALMGFIQRNWRMQADFGDLRQEIYMRVLVAAQRQTHRPFNTRAFVLAVARNHLIDRARRARIVRFEVFADLEGSMLADEAITPERVMTAREELRQVQAGLEQLPKRCRQVIELRRIEGLSQKETAARLGISVKAVEQQTTKGTRALIDFVLGGSMPRTPLQSIVSRKAGTRDERR